MKQAAYKPWLAAALDLGSNSFHVTIVDTRVQPYRVLFRYGEKVQLGAGLDSHNQLSAEALARGLNAIRGMADRMAQVVPQQRYIVATNTLRVASNRQDFIRSAEQILQAPVQVISGEREAQLIFAGVVDELSSLTLGNRVKLVIDIGGGSTEISCGNDTPRLLNSFPMGCVAYSREFFPDRCITLAAMQAAVQAARQCVINHVAQYQSYGWQFAVGSSGTIKALTALSGQKDQGLPLLTQSSMATIEQRIMQFATLDEVNLANLRPDRGEVLPAGYAITLGLMQAFQLDQLYFSSSALREGVIASYIKT
ncbi:MAG: Ppx/GppA family phosphatase [Gammaproteobacteria bacterium]|nr:Ppx/GppA family phosphatase [Gammaproteobacteria bacterium]